MRQIWRIIRFTSELKGYYIGISVFTVVLALVSQLQPLFTKAAVDEVGKIASGGDIRVWFVFFCALAIFLTDVAQTFFSNIGGHLGDMMAVKLKRLLSNRYYAHLLDLSQQYFDTELSGKIINRMNRGISQIGQFMQMMSNNFLQFIFSTIMSLAIVAYFSWQVAIMLLLLYPIFIWLTGRSSSKWQVYQTEINKQEDIASGRFAESIGQIKVVKGFLQEARELRFFGRHYDKIVQTTKPQSMFWHRQDVLRRLVLNVLFFFVFAYIFVETARGKYSLGTMVLLVQYAALIRIPIFSISFLVDQSQRAVSNTKDYFAAIDMKAIVVDSPGSKTLQVRDATIAFDDVMFSYSQDKPILRGVTFTVAAGQKVALVGESGEGKTTLTNLLLRLYDVDSGAITIDGQNIADVSQKSLRKQIAVVFQEPALFSGTIRENISYAKPSATLQEIERTAKAANAHEFIAKLENGYNTQIGERGLKLSGGQKQRIAIARALLKDAPILILDEATSSLDSRSEHLVHEALERLMRGRTVIIIAHRLSTIQNVDQIVTLRLGKVDEVGSPSKLKKTKGIYAELLALQQSATAANKKKLKKYEITT